MSNQDADEDVVSPTVSRAPRYEDEDISPTTRQELRGWYCYGVAAEVFAVTGSGSFLPVTIEQLARENGVLYSDRKTPCLQTAVKAARGLLARAPNTDKDQCIINFLGSDMTTSAYTMYTFSIAVLIQALTLVSFSSVADHGMELLRSRTHLADT
jgi:MFS transporter, UMF1 family